MRKDNDVCVWAAVDCCCYTAFNGKCSGLRDTRFSGRSFCPFYKKRKAEEPTDEKPKEK